MMKGAYTAHVNIDISHIVTVEVVLAWDWLMICRWWSWEHFIIGNWGRSWYTFLWCWA